MGVGVRGVGSGSRWGVGTICRCQTAALSKRQIRDRLMAQDAPADFDVPQRLWRATVEDTVDKVRAWQQAVIARPNVTAPAGKPVTNCARSATVTSRAPRPQPKPVMSAPRAPPGPRRRVSSGITWADRN